MDVIQFKIMKMKKINERLKGLWNEEEVYWFQRARVNWLKMRDKNAKFFHQATTQRRRNNKVLRIR